MLIATDQDRRLVLGSLELIGPAKPLGYLPLNTLEKYLSLSVDEVSKSFEKRGLATKVFPASQCCISSGAVYVYDRPALQKILDDAADLLAGHQWPTTSDLFVEHASKNWVETTHPVLLVIRRAFGERQ